MWRQIHSYFLPGAIERDPGFRDEIARLSRIALLVIGGVQIGVSLFMLAVRFVVVPDSSTLTLRLKQGSAIIFLGLVAMGASRIPRLARWWRAIAVLCCLLTVSILIWASELAASRVSHPEDFIPGQITLVLLMAVTFIPLRPLQMLAIGFVTGGVYTIAAELAYRRLGVGAGPDQDYLLFILMLNLLCTGLTGAVYQQRKANHELREVQTRMLMAENATSLTRLAAALSHELNNPMGALLSGVDTLLLLASKQATCGAQEQARLVLLQADLRKSIQQSAKRLKALVARIQRFTNLDQAEVQNANLNELLTDVAAIVEPQLPKTARLELDLHPLEPVVCRPQQISAVFSNLLSNAVAALNGSGGQIVLSSRQMPREVEIEVRDNGQGVDPAQLEGIFEPAFKAKGSRMHAANWSMFSSRQIIREHGGDIHIDSGQGKGTTVRVTLPVEQPLT